MANKDIYLYILNFSTSMRSQKGFSLVELMIVVGITGILASLALPRFKQFQAKAKMGEAKNILTHLYTLEQTYMLDNNVFVRVGAMGATLGTSAGSNCPVGGGAQRIGFTLDPCGDALSPVPRYSYNVVLPGGNSAQFLATAVSGRARFNRICPGNRFHIVTINETNTIIEPQIGLACPN